MAQKRKNSQKSNSKGSQAVVIFWLVFVIVIIIVFMVNVQTITKNFNLFKSRLISPSSTEEEFLETDDELVVLEQPQPEQTVEPVIVNIEPSPSSDKPESKTVEEDKPAGQTTRQDTQTSTQTPPPQTRERSVYFTRVDNDGQILQSRVIRRLPVSETPMQDVLNIMLGGPSAEEISRGALNFIPQNTRLLSAIVRGSTAYISFSEDFMFNTFGVEGYVAQLRQIVWTVTEFSNVNDVQILIEGRRLDYLGEGIWIGSPVSRASF